VQIVLGNKKTQIDKDQLTGLTKCYDSTVIDLGAGDGKYVYKSALDNPNNFYIAVDPSEKQLAIHAKKAARKRLPNVIFCLSSLENLPPELVDIADKVHINLPWGTLLKSVVLPSRESVAALSSIIVKGGKLEIIFGFDEKLEPSETERLELPEITLEYIQTEMVPVYTRYGFSLLSLQEIKKDELRSMKTTWSKRLSFGNMRRTYKLVVEKY